MSSRVERNVIAQPGLGTGLPNPPLIAFHAVWGVVHGARRSVRSGYRSWAAPIGKLPTPGTVAPLHPRGAPTLLVMPDLHSIRPGRGASVGPSNVAVQCVFGTLVPFKGDQAGGAEMRFPHIAKHICERVSLEASGCRLRHPSVVERLSRLARAMSRLRLACRRRAPRGP